MSGLFGEHHPVLGQGALPPLAGGGVGRGAQVDQGGGQGAAGGALAERTGTFIDADLAVTRLGPPLVDRFLRGDGA
ncbi:hypothetical protein AB0A67_30105, partial [Streptomyces eurythermus]